MKKDRSKQKLTKEDFEKFEYHDTRFYGLFYNKTDEGTKVKIDPNEDYFSECDSKSKTFYS